MIAPPWINEEFSAPRLQPAEMDALWAAGWRRFGSSIFRYSITLRDSGTLDFIVPLRIVLADFAASKSQRRIQRRNSDLAWETRPASLSREMLDLFWKHRSRFRWNAPDSLADFLGNDPAAGPCECLEFRCLHAGRSIAASFMDVGERSVSSVYAVFDPAESARSPGILTLLKEIEWAREHGMAYLHPGYTTLNAGIYEYKKRFRALEGYDWTTEQWKPWGDFARDLGAARVNASEANPSCAD